MDRFLIYFWFFKIFFLIFFPFHFTCGLSQATPSHQRWPPERVGRGSSSPTDVGSHQIWARDGLALARLPLPALREGSSACSRRSESNPHQIWRGLPHPLLTRATFAKLGEGDPCSGEGDPRQLGILVGSQLKKKGKEMKWKEKGKEKNQKKY